MDPAVAEKTDQLTEPKDLVFASEEARLKALTDLPDQLPDTIPANTDEAATWYKEQDTLQEKIESATIGEVPAEDPVITDQPKTEKPGDEKTGYNAEDWTFTFRGEKHTIPESDIPKDGEFTFPNAKKAFQGVVETQKYIKAKEAEYAQMKQDYNQKLLETENEKKVLQSKVDKPTAKEPPKPPVTDEEIQGVRTELDSLDKKLDEFDDDLDDPEALKLTRKSQKLSRKLQKMSDDRHAFDMGERNREWKEYQETQRLEKEERDNTTKAESAKAEKDSKIKTAREKLESFRTDIPELKGTMTYNEMENQYIQFGRDIAATYYDKNESAVTASETEITMNKYLNKVPSLMEKLGEQGKLGREPNDLRRYLILSEIDMLRKGLKLNLATGKWEESETRHPDLQSSYDYWKRINGVRAKERIADMEKGAAEMLKAVQSPKTTEIEAGVGTQKESLEAMSVDSAVKNLEMMDKQAKTAGFSSSEEWVENISRSNAQDPRVLLWDKCVNVITEAK